MAVPAPMMATTIMEMGARVKRALQRANSRFIQRFGHVEAELGRRGRTPAQSTLAEMEALWQQAKRRDGAA